MPRPSPAPRGARRPIRLAAALLALLAPACGNVARYYDGPERPRDEVAVIQPSTRILFVWKIDLVEVGAVDGKDLKMKDYAVEVLPGRHVVSARRGFGTGPKVEENLVLEAKPGRVYEVHKHDIDYSERRVAFWIVDTTDGSIVSGERPADADDE
jgi:hypothetical protein